MVERALVDEHVTALPTVTVASYDEAVALASAPHLVRGYEEIKLASVVRYRAEAGRCAAARAG